MAFTSKEQQQKYYAAFRKKCFDVLGWECTWCGSKANLEIDHINWRTKVIDISKHSAPKWWPAVREELKKCQTLCCACHKRKTAREDIARKTKPAVHGTSYQYKKGCRCAECVHVQSIYKQGWRLKTGETKYVRGPYQKARCGRVAMYRKGCRCELCRAANAAKARNRRAKFTGATADRSSQQP